MKTSSLFSVFSLLTVLSAGAAGYTNSWTSFSQGNIVPDGQPEGWQDTRTLNVSNETILTIGVTLDMANGFNGDMYARLTHGTDFAILLNRPGLTAGNRDGYSDSGVQVTFDDSPGAGNDVHLYRNWSNPGGGVLTGVWASDGRNTDPSSVLDTDLRLFTLDDLLGKNASGDWTLFLMDASSGEEMSVNSWGLQITTVPEPSSVSLMLLGLLAVPGARCWWRNRRTRRQGGTEARIVPALIALCFLVTQSALAAGIPWSNGQQNEYSISGFTASDSVTVDAAHGKLYVTDRDRYRVLRFAYPLTSDLTVADAEMVFGQADLSGSSPNRGGSVAANSLGMPYGLAVGPSGELWISDYGNNRLLKFANAWSAASGAAASVVLGQSSFTASGGSTTAGGLQSPCGLSFDGSGNLWVADMGNHRALRFNNAGSKTSGASADGVLGQADFNSGSPNRGGSTAANTLANPYGVGAAGTTVWTAEYGNCRVLRFDAAAGKANGAAADGVLGQADFTGNSSNRGGGIAANTLSHCGGVAGDADGRLYVCDSFNSRVLIYDDAATKANGAAADNVLGATMFTTSGSLGSVWHLFYDNTNHRLLVGNVGNSSIYQYFNSYLTTTTLSSFPNPATTVGESVTFTATVTTASSGPIASGNVAFKEGATVLGIGALDGSGQATFSTSSLGDGNHSIVASFTNTATHEGSASDPLIQVIGKYTPTVSLIASINPAPAGSPVIFTATVNPPGGAPTPTGSVEFLDGGSSVATVTLDSGAAASWTNSSLAEGAHTIAAHYLGDGNFRPATNTLNQTITPAGSYSLAPVANIERDVDGTNVIVYDGNAYGGYVYAGSFAPATGWAAFKFDLSSLSGTISSATLKVRIADKSLEAADFNVRLHTSDDDAWTDTPIPTAPTNMNPSVLATFAASSVAVNDWVSEDVTAFVQAELAGDKAATFVFDADIASGNNYIGFYAKEIGAGYRPVLEVQMMSPTTTTVSGSPNPSAYGQSVTFTATVTRSSGSATPSGTVTFKEGATTLGTGSLSGSGGGATATYSTSTLPSGSHTVTAEYEGDANFNASSGSTSPAQTVDKATPSVTAWPTASDIIEGQALSDSTLTNGSASVAGNFAFTTPSTTPPVGTAAQAVTFVPADPTNYNTVAGSVNVTVNRANHSPTDIALSHSSVNENQSSGTVVGNLSTTDPDTGDTFTYALVSGAGSEDNGSFSISGGVLRTAAIFDYELKSSQSIRVRSTDQGGLYVEKQFTVTVLDLLETTPAGGAAWTNGGSYNWKINDATGAVGGDPGWDLLSITGTLDITATAGTPFNLNLTTLLLNNTPGSMAHFTNTAPYAWKIISTSAGIIGFDPGKFVLNTNGVVNDLGGGTLSLTVSGDDLLLAFNPAANHAPAANPNTLATTQNKAAQVTAAKLAANDTDADGDTLAVTGVSAGSAGGGTVSLAAGEVTYTPAPGYTGVDSFTYSIADGHGGVATATVTVTVRANTTAQPNMMGIQKVGEDYQVRFAGLGGRQYQVQRAPTVSGPWTDLTPVVTMPAYGVATFTDTPPDNGSYFYRAMLAP